MDTNQLIKGCKNNDYKAQMLVYHQFKHMMYGAVVRILKQKEDAEDIVHDAFIKAFQKIHQLENDTFLGGWLKRIAINTALDFLKKNNDVALVDETFIKDEVEEDDEINEDIPYETVLECMQQLKEKYRIVLNLYLVENYNHREISELLQTNESTVRNQYKRAKNQLVSLLKKYQKL